MLRHNKLVNRDTSQVVGINAWKLKHNLMQIANARLKFPEIVQIAPLWTLHQMADGVFDYWTVLGAIVITHSLILCLIITKINYDTRMFLSPSHALHMVPTTWHLTWLHYDPSWAVLTQHGRTGAQWQPLHSWGSSFCLLVPLWEAAPRSGLRNVTRVSRAIN